MIKKFFWLFVFLSASLSLNAFEMEDEKISKEEEGAIEAKDVDKEDFVETQHKITINGELINYKAVTGSIILREKEEKPEAKIFFVSYTKEGENPSDRPITFCFNGGPGSSSVWLHLGWFGPKRLLLTDLGEAIPPYKLIDNEYCLLDKTDIVFIDPVSTGYSRAVSPKSAKSFHGFEEDVKSIAEFIRIYLSRFNRWDSPKFLEGESYGTTRAIALASYLHDHCFIYLDGVILVSAVLDFQTREFDEGNDLGYLSFFPSYVAAAWYYKKLSPELQSNFTGLMNEVRHFVENEYACALYKGSKLTPSERENIVKKIAKYTSLSPDYIEKSNLRIKDLTFMKKLLEKEDKIVGRFDSRYSGLSINPLACQIEYDPSAESLMGAFTAAVNQYIKNGLKYEKLIEYKVLTNVFPWNYGGQGDNKYLQVCSDLRNVMIKNPYIRIYIANGYFDLATPFYSTEYSINHLNLPGNVASNISMKYYDAGHMMYVFKPTLIQMRKDMVIFYKEALDKKKPFFIRY